MGIHSIKITRWVSPSGVTPPLGSVGAVGIVQHLECERTNLPRRVYTLACAGVQTVPASNAVPVNVGGQHFVGEFLT